MPHEQASKQVTLGELKGSLSALLKEAYQGQVFVVTRRGTPVARITGPLGEHVHIGKDFGKGTGIRPLFDRPREGPSILDVLLEDRYGDSER